MTNQLNNALANLPSYSAYLVRLWQEAPDTPWRASAQSVQSSEIVRFGSLQALFQFLELQTARSGLANAPPDDDQEQRSHRP
ncbi:MAG: hypothetical protein KDE54_04225 [Caldilineaceae bacterium]|nr:hypothetical protein [Caldilineaceae bacterium]MCB0138491.1 hypothetical protein [Caldilineaceae bacterium]